MLSGLGSATQDIGNVVGSKKENDAESGVELKQIPVSYHHYNPIFSDNQKKTIEIEAKMKRWIITCLAIGIIFAAGYGAGFITGKYS